jgi:hypothetical protein
VEYESALSLPIHTCSGKISGVLEVAAWQDLEDHIICMCSKRNHTFHDWKRKSQNETSPEIHRLSTES